MVAGVEACDDGDGTGGDTSAENNGDGVLSAEEYDLVALPWSPLAEIDDGDGQLTAAELDAAFRKVSPTRMMRSQMGRIREGPGPGPGNNGHGPALGGPHGQGGQRPGGHGGPHGQGGHQGPGGGAP